MVLEKKTEMSKSGSSGLIVWNTVLDHQNCKWLPVLSFLACFTGKTGELRNTLVTKLEKKSGVLTLALKLSADAGHSLCYLQHCVDYFPCYLGCDNCVDVFQSTLLTPKPATFRAWGVG